MIKKVLSITLIMILTLSFVKADALTDLNNQYDSIKAEQQATINKLSGLEKEIAQDMYELTLLDQKMSQYSVKLSDLEKKSQEVNDKLKEQENNLQNAATGYNSAEEIYATRLKIIYENGIPSILDILLSSNGISDFFSRMNVLNSILDYDKSLVGNMQSQKEYIDYIKKNISIQKAQLDQLKYDTEKSTQALNSSISAKESKMTQMENDKKNLNAKKQALAKQEADASAKIQEELKKLESTGGTFNGMFTWPVPGHKYISAYFMDPEYKLLFGFNHTGLDIAGSGISGKPIVAIESGTVIKAVYGGTGYGNYVIIDHGKNTKDGKTYRSLYGHATSLNVTKGQKVTMGQTIANVGSTGNSTGPHLHIEIYQNNVLVDPYKLLK